MRTFLTILLCTLFYSGFSFGTDWNVYVAKYRHDKVCAISYTFDDGLAEHYTLAAPQLEQRGFRGTFFVNGSKVNKDERRVRDTTRVTWPQLKEMAENGQCLVHTLIPIIRSKETQWNLLLETVWVRG